MLGFEAAEEPLAGKFGVVSSIGCRWQSDCHALSEVIGEGEGPLGVVSDSGRYLAAHIAGF